MPGNELAVRQIVKSHVRNGVKRKKTRPATRSKTATLSYPDESIVLKVPKINSLDTSTDPPILVRNDTS